MIIAVSCFSESMMCKQPNPAMQCKTMQHILILFVLVERVLSERTAIARYADSGRSAAYRCNPCVGAAPTSSWKMLGADAAHSGHCRPAPPARLFCALACALGSLQACSTCKIVLCAGLWSVSSTVG